MKSFASRAAGTLILLSVLSSTAESAIIEQTRTVTFENPFSINMNGQNFQSSSVTFDKFAGPGTLNSATVQIANFNGSGRGSFTPVTGDSVGRVIATASLFYPFAVGFDPVSVIGQFTSGTAAPLQRLGFNYSFGVSSSSFDLLTVMPLSDFSGAVGTFDFETSMTTRFLPTPGELATGSLTGTGSFDVILRYDYTPDIAPVPLPPVAWLFGSSLISMLSFFRRRA